jgi:acyl-CoA thioester hydrolase
VTTTLPPVHTAESPVFQLEIVAAPDDIDELDHVSNIAYVRWVLRVAQAHSDAVGWDYKAYVALGAVFVVRRHEVDYLRPALLGDRIVLSTWIESWAGASCVRRTSIVRQLDGVELCKASTQWALMTAASGRPTRITPALLDAFRRPV